jgi:hypothetical protein
VTDVPGGAGAPRPVPEPPSRRRIRTRAVLAGIIVTSPLLLLVLLDAAALLQAFLDPSSTCWMQADIAAGRRPVSPFEIHLLFFVATIQFWAPIVLLIAVLFWYLEWIRVRQLVAVALLSAAVLYLVGFEYHWMVELYRGRSLSACG